MAAYRRVYESRHLQADCQEPGSAPEPYTLCFGVNSLEFIDVDGVAVCVSESGGLFCGVRRRRRCSVRHERRDIS